ncbi:MAG TPA: hypothetical protein PKC43_06945 [Phycisphaerales bacterium]|nr:hypothetical protein [Phycisphaerales bacterium]HMP37170.1 hypothetical protein [Phycisphaerales bacterium]
MAVLRSSSLALVLLLAGCDRGGGDRDAGPSAAVDRAAIEAALRSAQRLLDERRVDEAVLVAGTLASRAPDSWEAAELHARTLVASSFELAGRGREAESSQRHALAAAEYRRAAELAQCAAIWHAAGIAAAVAGERGAAIESFRRAAAADPESAQAPIYEAQVHLGAGDLDAAEEALRRAAALQPEEPFVLATQAELARARGDMERAFSLIRAARRRGGAELSFRVVEARFLRQSQRPREAIELLAALGPAVIEHESATDELAHSWIALGEPRRAAELWGAFQLAHPPRWRSGLRAAEAWIAAGDAVRADLALREVELRVGAHPEAVALRERLVGAAPTGADPRDAR